MKKNKKTPILVTFGHMHEKLKLSNLNTYLKLKYLIIKCEEPGKKRKRVVYDSTDKILYLNTAVVPRVERVRNGTKHHFCIVKIKDHQVIEAKDIWIKIKNNTYIGIEEKLLFKYVKNGNIAKINLYDNYESKWLEKSICI